jgi:non-ribosomal peptide synthetase component F
MLFHSLVAQEPGGYVQQHLSTLHEALNVDAFVHEHTSYPLMLAAYGEPELLLKIEYDRGRFDAPTITRMLTHLQTALESMAAYPDQRVADVSLLNTSERQQLLERWNQTAADYPRNTCIHHLFEAQVERTPQAMAFQCGTAQVIYRELNERASQLAHHLRARGVGPDVLVGICVERSLEMAVGLLGILKAVGPMSLWIRTTLKSAWGSCWTMPRCRCSSPNST